MFAVQTVTMVPEEVIGVPRTGYGFAGKAKKDSAQASNLLQGEQGAVEMHRPLEGGVKQRG